STSGTSRSDPAEAIPHPVEPDETAVGYPDALPSTSPKKSCAAISTIRRQRRGSRSFLWGGRSMGQTA
ncbi:MAG: hypothetical protein ACFNUC_09550, partial [Selenomonas noxia]